MVKYIFLYFLLILQICNSYSSNSYRPRGVPIFRAPLYVDTNDLFTCLDGLSVIPFSQINDDYCDCDDGSDEPGTSACPNGIFFCNNAGYKSVVIPSSRVNDGICDCCDTSDEYNTTAQCVNTCYELGREALIEAEKKAELSRRGYQLRNELIQQGKLFKSKQQEKIQSLEKSILEATQLKEERLALKKDAELLESTALQQYQEAARDVKEDEGADYEAYEVFDLIDTNGNQVIEVAELQTHLPLDQNNDGTVSLEEARYFLNEKDEVTLDEFVKEAWLRIKPFHMKSSGLFKGPKDDAEDVEGETETENENDENVEENEKDESEIDKKTEETQPAYDDETQRLINLATEARNNYNNAEQELQTLERDMTNLKETLNKDFGLHEEYAVLNEQCYEFEDREYIYKLCLFDKVTQRSRNSGSETRLGTWGHWSGPNDNKYSAMTYSQGTACWNGPQRSTIVNIACGLETKLVAVSEPNRCEYKFSLESPAACFFSDHHKNDDQHDEL